MRPTGPLHVGHLLGALDNWVKLQQTHECFFMVADLHALMGEYENPVNIRENSIKMVEDWIGAGIDPERSTLFIQSEIPEHSELAVILGMITPLGWLERNPTYKEQLREITGRDLTTYGFLGYPVLQAADILLYKAHVVPVGEDQLAHLELTREIVRRFKFLYKKDIFPEPLGIMTKEARILGTDRRKMSKSYGNAIDLSDSAENIRKKTVSMITDPARLKVTDPGHPEACNVFSYYRIFTDETKVNAVRDWCTGAKKGCIDCKKEMAETLTKRLEPFRSGDPVARRAEAEVALKKGRERASVVARQTLKEVKELLHL